MNLFIDHVIRTLVILLLVAAIVFRVGDIPEMKRENAEMKKEIADLKEREAGYVTRQDVNKAIQANNQISKLLKKQGNKTITTPGVHDYE